LLHLHRSTLHTPWNDFTGLHGLQRRRRLCLRSAAEPRTSKSDWPEKHSFSANRRAKPVFHLELVPTGPGVKKDQESFLIILNTGKYLFFVALQHFEV
jgi:hypothetical protein